MMKRSMVFILAFALTVIGGCGARKPEFNQTYLPNAAPGSPHKRINLPKQATDKAAVTTKSGLFSTTTTHLPTAIYWLDEDKLLFHIMSADSKSLLHSFLVTPNTGEVTLLQGAEKDELITRIEKDAVLADNESKAGAVAKEIVNTLVAFIFQVDPAKKKYYAGKRENNGVVLDFIISVKKEGRKEIYDCDYVAKNAQTGKALQGNMRIDGQRIRSLPAWLKSWKISPDGNYYVIGSTAMFVDPENTRAPFTGLITNFEHAYAGFDISPRWDQIALLIMKEDEKTKARNYQIELYPFSWMNKRGGKEKQF